MRIVPPVALICVAALLPSVQAREAESTPYHPGRVIVRFDSPVDSSTAARLLDAGLFTVDRVLYPRLDIWQVSLSRGFDVPAALDLLDKTRGVRWCQADHLLDDRDTTPNDPQFGSQWDMSIIDAPLAWDAGTGGTDALGAPIVAAICDGGIDLNHPDLLANQWTNAGEVAANGVDDDGNGYIDDVHGWNAYNNTPNLPVDGHGTHVSGTVAAVGNNGVQVSGINWNCQLLHAACSSSNTSIVAIGYGYVAAMKALWIGSDGAEGANIVTTNSSFGVNAAFCTSGNYPIWNDLYDDMGGLGILSAGATANANLNVDAVGDIPTSCSSPWLITVTNTTSADARNASAAYGLTTVDLGAPGTGVLSTYSGGGTTQLTGTSMATPHVAGAVAFLHSVASTDFAVLYRNDPGAAALLIKDWILAGVDPLPSLAGITVSGGRLNLANSALLAGQFSTGPNPYLTLVSPSLEYSLAEGQTETRILEVQNTGEAGSQLDWTVTVREPAVTRSMAGSSLGVDAVQYLPGSTLELAIDAVNGSTDQEWIAGITLHLPAGVGILDAGALVSSGSAQRMLHWDENTAGPDVVWQDATPPWGEIYPQEHATGTVTLDFTGAAGPVEIGWTIQGDIFGGDPHQVSGSFVLEPIGPGVVVIQPAADARWFIGESRSLLWNSHEGIGNATLRLSRNGGLDWDVLATGEPDDGQLDWLVTGPPTTEALLEISLPDAGLVGTSDLFRIDQPLDWLTVTPDSGSVADGNSQPVSVSIDAAGLFPGVYTAELWFNTNHNDASAIVQLTVTEGAPLVAPQVTLAVAGGQVTLGWSPVPGAGSYRVEGRSSSSQPWSVLATTTGTQYTQPTTLGVRLFRVTAIQ